MLLTRNRRWIILSAEHWVLRMVDMKEKLEGLDSGCLDGVLVGCDMGSTDETLLGCFDCCCSFWASTRLL